ncbi:hypothetical protein NXS15_01640 [Mycoplasma sp. CSL7475-4]|uniref:hypothetical protein n=1 Tax=Mycoplasma sp. CSL7475-4 TaxID=2973942 RepID=UPI00216AB5CD|nr:hypothetical protein [Mycoplasma sp. CSL7475-4]MCS4536825.1 hypothetical protein [Mycoplasma sp. CSL7475-4]
MKKKKLIINTLVNNSVILLPLLVVSCQKEKFVNEKAMLRDRVNSIKDVLKQQYFIEKINSISNRKQISEIENEISLYFENLNKQNSEGNKNKIDNKTNSETNDVNSHEDQGQKQKDNGSDNSSQVVDNTKDTDQNHQPPQSDTNHNNSKNNSDPTGEKNIENTDETNSAKKNDDQSESISNKSTETPDDKKDKDSSENNDEQDVAPKPEETSNNDSSVDEKDNQTNTAPDESSETTNDSKNTDNQDGINENTTIKKSDKTSNEYGNVLSLQSANDYTNEDLNISDFSDAIFDRTNLISSNNSYQKYFDTIDKHSTWLHSNDADLETIKGQNINIESINVADNNVIINLNKNQYPNKTPSMVLVKSWNDEKPWSKWINLHEINSSSVAFDYLLLNNKISKFVIVQMEFNNGDVSKIAFDKKNSFNNTLSLNNLKIDSFNVYKDNKNKNIYGSIALNLTENQHEYISDKIIALTFSVKEKIYKPETDLFGSPTNSEEEFNKENSVPNRKRIYLNYNQLHKFKLNGLQEKIQYKLNELEVLNTDFSPVQTPIKITNTNWFAFNFNWISDHKLNDQLIEYTHDDVQPISKESLIKNNRNNLIDFSVKNLSTLIDYNFEKHNFLTRYPNNKNNINFKDYSIVKNNKEQQLHWFKTRNFLSKQIINIDKNGKNANIVKKINSIQGLNNIDPENVLLWINLQLDTNPINSRLWTEFNDVHSRVRIPISLKSIQENSVIEDVDFLFDYVSEDPKFQQDLAAKIKSLVKFDLHLNGDDLELKLSAREGFDTSFTNLASKHNTATNHSIFIDTADLFVYWIQDKNTDKLLSFKEVEMVDNLSIKPSTTSYNDTYDIKTETVSHSSQQISKYEVKDVLIPTPSAEETGRRLFQQDSSVGIEQGRKRMFSLSNKFDGTWNVISKVNDDPNDFRFWVFANYHVWNVNTSKNSGLFSNKTTGEFGNDKYSVNKGQLVVPTLISKDDNRQGPIYGFASNLPDLEVTGNLYDFNFANSNNAITIELIKDFSRNKANNFDDSRDNEGFIIDKNNLNSASGADIAIAIIDFKVIFEKFGNGKLDNYVENGSFLSQRQKNAIQHILNFKDLEPMKFSKKSRYMNSDNNLNFYIASLPKVNTSSNEDGYANIARYREYLFALNTLKISLSEPSTIFKGFQGASWWETRYFDLFSGSSGSGIYDHEGNLVGLNTQGSPARKNNFTFSETQKYSFFGNDDTQYNPGSFYEINKKLAYLYPNDFKNIFND